MSHARQVVQSLGKSGIAFLAALLLFIVFYALGLGGWAFLMALALIPTGIPLAIRAARYLQRHGLWSVRNRLLLVYILIGVLPILFVFVLIGLGAWALTNELANYLASSALARHVKGVQFAVEDLHHAPPDHQLDAASAITRGFRSSMPGFCLYIKDAAGIHVFPAGSPPLSVPTGWKNTNGLLVMDGHFYTWAHSTEKDEEVTALAPLTDEQVENLVPNLGAISIFENPGDGHAGETAAAGSFRNSDLGNSIGSDPDFNVKMKSGSRSGNSGANIRLPPPAFRFDIPILWPATLVHNHIETPNKNFGGVLWVYSRPSAVLRSFFSGTEMLRGVLFDGVVAVAILFFIVELFAVIVGVRLATRLTGAVNSIYEGTRRVIFGDFGLRIPVRSHDQLGELAESFNQMTGNLERLLVVEKEKERLQTEIEIAREVQGQLYPKEAPPICGLKLTVRCDPARMVSGDYYDYQELGGKRLAFAIGDVAGKGISAALLMATLQAALRAQIAQFQPMNENHCEHGPEIDVSKLVSALNQQIYAHTSPEKYATFFFAVFDETSRTLTYTNAGHLSPLLIRRDGVIPLDSNGTVVGAFPFSQYDESCLILDPGDLLICYTDGITEPENAYGEEFGEARLVELVQKHAHRDDHEIVQIVLDAVRGWTGTPELHDDMTLLLAREIQTA
jgi:sigma-B regulation protein RsbU (phosphoserine phosphatase)